MSVAFNTSVGGPNETMMREYTLTIRNDLELPVDYEVSINNKLYKGVSKNGVSEYHFYAHEGSWVKIKKENKWIPESKINTVFMFLYALDLVWGNIMESDNLPIGADTQIELSQNNEIHLSNILNTTSNGIKRWTKGAYLQYFMVFIVILFVSFVIFMASSFPINIVICALIAIGTIFLFSKAQAKLLRIKAIIRDTLLPVS